MRIFGVIIVFFLLSGYGLSQDIPDTLIYSFENARNDTARINALIRISDYFQKNDANEALKYAQDALELSQKINYSRLVASAYFRLGHSIEYLGHYREAVHAFSESTSLFEYIGNRRGLAACYNSFGWLWSEIEDWEKAFSYFKLALEIYEEIGSEIEVGSIYLNYGSVLDELGKHDEALYYYKSAMEMFEQLHDTTMIVHSYLNIGNHYQLMDNMEEAGFLYQECLRLCKIKNDIKDLLAESYLHIGRLANAKQQYESAIDYLDSAFQMANEVGVIEYVMDASEGLSIAYAKLNEFRLAYQYKNLHDSLMEQTGENEKRLAQIEWERDLEFERSLQEKELQKQKIIRNFSLVLFLLGIVILAVLYRNYRMKQKSIQLLAEIDQLKSRMFSNISHEFRTPLTLIMGPLEEMLREESDKKPSVKTIQMMRRNANQLLSLVNQMMDLSKMDAGQLKLELTEGDVIRAVKVMILVFSSLAEKKNIHYEFDIPGGDCITFYDQDKLEKITNNLLSNAFKFTPEEGRVIVRIGLDSERKTKPLPPFTCQAPVLKIVVEDTGKGIPKDQLKKVFDRFHQVEGSYELENIGTGIGLALTQELVDLMHGNISVDSTLGSGSVFTVSVPLGKEHLSDNEFTIVEEIEESAMTKKDHLIEDEDIISDVEYVKDPSMQDLPSILIVEDHADIRQHIRENMSYYNILEAENGKDGFEQAAENIPDLIITDLMRPEMDGVELCKSLKTDERTSHIPVIMLTAKASVEDRIEGLETGADDYITKPFNMKELKVRINNLIEQRRKLRERFTKELNLGPKDIAVTSADERFLNRIIEVIENNITDADLDVAGLSDQVAMSRMQLYRKIKALTDQSPSEFIRTIRLKRAAQLMRDKFGNIAEITYEAGFNHPSYFAKSFKELFGESPSDYIKNH